VACAGLRASEVAALRVMDFRDVAHAPYLSVVGKGRRHRRVPADWSPFLLPDLRDYLAREVWGMLDPRAPLVAHEHPWRGAGLPGRPAARRGAGRPLNRFSVRDHWKRALSVLGRGVAGASTVHAGRHTFVSHALAAGFDIEAVRAAAGHESLAVTTRYAHPVKSITPGALYSPTQPDVEGTRGT
jgi:site-specific recombinase XerD